MNINNNIALAEQLYILNRCGYYIDRSEIFGIVQRLVNGYLCGFKAGLTLKCGRYVHNQLCIHCRELEKSSYQKYWDKRNG